MTAFTPPQLNPSTLLPLIKTFTITLTNTLRYALIYALLISSTIMIQNSSYFLTPLALYILQNLGFTASFSDDGPLRQERLLIHHVTTMIVAAHWSLVLTLGLWTAGRFGIGVKVEMEAVEMGWYGGKGGKEGDTKEEE
ncbi:MAG: hypothetical protein LQ337_004843 [Flavoplaca oasis]|nr:MAG: hypothetical protein LQ337_004843 [Flavoplaca oasis]